MCQVYSMIFPHPLTLKSMTDILALDSRKFKQNNCLARAHACRLYSLLLN